MTDVEVADFVRAEGQTMVLSTLSADGSIHSVAMWYGLLPAPVGAFSQFQVGLLTKRTSQKVRNLEREPRVTCLIEAGAKYRELRGVELVGRASISGDTEVLTALAVSVRERYATLLEQPTSDPIDAAIHNRVAVLVAADRVVSWDHRKL